MGLDLGGVFKAAVPLAATAFGGPIAGAAAGALFGGAGDKGGAGGIQGLLGMFAGGAKPPGMGMMPDLAKAALSMFKDAAPGERGKLLDIAIMALGGDPKTSPGQGAGQGMTALSSPGNGLASAANDTGAKGRKLKADDDATPAKASAAKDGGAKAGPAEKFSVERGADGSVKVNYERSGDTEKSGAASATSGTGSSSGAPLTVKGNEIDTGRYTITASKDDGGTVKVFDKQTNTFVKAFGDPHVETSDGDKMGFTKNGLSISLPDGTNVHMKPTDVKDGVSWIDSAMVEKDGKAVTLDNIHGKGDIKTSQPKTGTDELRQDYMTQGQTVLDASSQDVGDLYMTGADGKRTKEIVNTGKEMSLDGMGGALNTADGAGRGEGTSDARGKEFAVNAELLGKLGQILGLTGRNVPEPAMQQDLLKGIQEVLQTFIKPAGAAAA